MAGENLHPEVIQPQDKRKITYKPLDQLPNGGINALENGCYEMNFKRQGREYTISIYVNRQDFDTTPIVPWIVRGGLNDRRRIYEHVCEELAQSGVVVYIEQKKRKQSKSNNVFQEDSRDVCNIVKNKLSVKNANLVAHSLSTIEAAYAAKSELFSTVILAAPVGLEKGSLGGPLKANHSQVRDLAHRRNISGAEDPELGKKALRSIFAHPGKVFRKLREKSRHCAEAEKGVLKKQLLDLAREGKTDIVLLLPRNDPYSNSANMYSLRNEIDIILSAREKSPNIYFLTPYIPKVDELTEDMESEEEYEETKRVLDLGEELAAIATGEQQEAETKAKLEFARELQMHGFVSLGRPEDVATIFRSLVKLMSEQRREIIEIGRRIN